MIWGKEFQSDSSALGSTEPGADLGIQEGGLQYKKELIQWNQWSLIHLVPWQMVFKEALKREEIAMT